MKQNLKYCVLFGLAVLVIVLLLVCLDRQAELTRDFARLQAWFPSELDQHQADTAWENRAEIGFHTRPEAT